MARIESLSILTTEEGKAYLAEQYGKVIQNVQKGLISGSMKNTELSGDPTSGSVEAKRFANANSQEYGSARAAGKGAYVKAKPVVVQIEFDREIVEEVEEKDTKLFGVEGLLQKRFSNHSIVMDTELDTAFFACAAESAVEVEIAAGTAIEDELEQVIQECENTKNEFVNGVPRAMMHMVMGTKYYGKVRNNLDKQVRSNVDTDDEEFYSWHGVEVKSCVNLPDGVDYLLMVTGAVAEPVMSNAYGAEKIPLSEAYAVSLFYHYGVACVTPDLIFKKKQA